MAAAKYIGTLFFDLSGQTANTFDSVRCLAEQTGELIEFAEKSVPGIKYNEDTLIEMMAMDDEAFGYQADTYELRKKVPCPLSAQDCFRIIRRPSHSPNPKRVLEYTRSYRDELFERAEKGISGVKEEKLRIAWLATGPFGRETYDLLARKGVSMVLFHRGGTALELGMVHPDYSADTGGRKIAPLEELVTALNTNIFGGSSEMWVDPLIKACRDMKIDAVVDFLQVGCIVVKGLKRVTAQRLWDELHIPTLDLEGRELFSTEEATVEMNKKLEEFLDMCIANKK
jgi:benzoyl-CoA reductase/2-hydroxyglutaryl-CoA dehydratase subunit BcrC/BadD/HgdB